MYPLFYESSIRDLTKLKSCINVFLIFVPIWVRNVALVGGIYHDEVLNLEWSKWE